MLRQGSNLRVDSLLGAELAGNTNTSGVSLDRLEQKSAGHAAEVTGGFRVGKGLVSSFLLQAGEVGHLSRAGGGSGITQEAKDGVLDLLGVVQVEKLAGDDQDEVMRVFLGDLTLVKVSQLAGSKALEARNAQRRCRSKSKKGGGKGQRWNHRGKLTMVL